LEAIAARLDAEAAAGTTEKYQQGWL
jgi:hypothetical protein